MEKGSAHYDLQEIKNLIKNDEYRITNSARVSYAELGLCDEDVLEIIASLKPNELYKSMTSYRNHKIWHDVYIKKLDKLSLYIKLQIYEKAIIISFKERT